MAILASLASECRAASESVGRDARGAHDGEVLRQAARELAVLVDACGGPVVIGSASSRSVSWASLVAHYRCALEAPLPRAVREALRTQLSRLEGEIAPPRAA